MGPRYAPLTAVILQVLLGGEVGIKAGDLHHGPGTGPGLLQLPLPYGPKKLYLSGGGHRLGRCHPYDSGLARAVAAHKTVDLPLGNGQIHMVYRQMTAVAFCQATGHQYVFCHFT